VNILWLKTELLHPIDKGGKIRTYQILRELKREHRITYLTLDDGTASQDERQRAIEYCDELVCVPHRLHNKFSAAFYFQLLLNLVSGLPYAVQKYTSAPLRREIINHVASSPVDVVVCDFLAPSANVPRDLSRPSILFQHNVEAVIWKRHFEVQTNFLKRLYLKGQWLKMRRFERETCRRFDCVIAVSEKDRELMFNDYEVETVFDVPTGVDTEFFRPSGTVQVDPNSIVFTGSMDWLPNQDAIRYFVEEIMPAIKKARPHVTLTVVGRNPDSALLELSKRDRSISVTGRVDDVRPYIERAAVYVVPLRVGSGTRLKIFEAMAMEKAIVSTTVGAEGLAVRPGVELILADSPAGFAESVVKVLADKELAGQLGQKAAQTVREQFCWPKVAKLFSDVCEEVLCKHRFENVLWDK